MPLVMSAAYDRPQTIVFDPNSEAECKDAASRAQALAARGFLCTHEEPGAYYYTPPVRDENALVFAVLSQNGDDRVVWDRSDPEQVREASSRFSQLVAKGHTPFAVRRDGSKGHKLDHFDPALSEILFVPSTIPG